MKFIWIILSIVILSGCSTMGGSIGIGAAAGGTAGALIGNQSGTGSQRGKLTLQGAAIGAALGGLIGYAAHVGKKDKQEAAEKQIALGEPDKKAPSLTVPKVRRIKVPAEIQGDKYIEEHYVYIIDKTSSWSR